MPLEHDSAAGFGLEDVFIFGCDRVDAEVPDAKIDRFVGDDFHKGKLAEVERLSAAEDQTQRHPRLVEQYSYRARAATRFSEAADSLTEHRREHFKVVLAAVGAGRAEILKLHQAGSIHDRVLDVLEHDLDLEEMAARRYLGEPEGA